MNAIDTHDTPRFADRADSARQLVAAGLAFTLPGTPVVFAGDEFALQGANGEASRTPLPWSDGAPLLQEYRALSALRRNSPALQDGSVRWLYADDEALAFLRETAADGANLVVAFRSADEIVLPPHGVGALRTEASIRFGGIEAEIVGDQMRWRSSGPAFGVWAVGGIQGERMPGADEALLVPEHA
jgi:alpha-glucosidase